MDQKESYTNRQNNSDSISYVSQDNTHTDSSPTYRHARDLKNGNVYIYIYIERERERETETE